MDSQLIMDTIFSFVPLFFFIGIVGIIALVITLIISAEKISELAACWN